MEKMTFQQKIKDLIGEGAYNKLDKETNNEVSLALKMPLKDEYGQDKYYKTRFVTPMLFSEFELFKEKDLTIIPTDIMHVLFKCKMFFVVKNEEEYRQRIGGSISHVDENDFAIPWSKKNLSLDELINEYLDRLETFQNEKTLMVQINSFHDYKSNHQEFFNRIFQKLNFPFVAYFDKKQLVKNYKKFEPGFKKYRLEDAKRFFCYPSIGFTSFGSNFYCYAYASAWLRTFLCLLKIAGFLKPGQIDFGSSGVEIVAPTSPVFLGTHSIGCFCWEEDKKEPWSKIPDGCLWRSFGYRGISKIWLDTRTYDGIEAFLIEYKQILDLLKNPWDSRYLTQVAPTLDILSSSTQIPDLGAKVLLIYCCLEHLFMPENVRSDNKKYIVGGINALRSDLLEWFNRLYALRCDYAHKGFIKRDDRVLGLVMESIKNVMILLKIKLNTSTVS
ncbi:MAG: hypothetical protein NTZ25_00235 [Candidatus Peregrinibacteria bacterium]|nr:hypothetical protein [Candidatus Peregrinibacteria bacterium]